MRILLVVFVAVSAGIALWQYNSPVNFIAQLMGISWGALAGAFLGPFLWGLYSGRISKISVWVSFVLGVGLTTSNMFLSFIDSPVNCGALAMVLSLLIVPLVSLFTPSVPFDVKLQGFEPEPAPRRGAHLTTAAAAPAQESEFDEEDFAQEDYDAYDGEYDYEDEPREELPELEDEPVAPAATAKKKVRKRVVRRKIVRGEEEIPEGARVVKVVRRRKRRPATDEAETIEENIDE